MVRSLVCFPYQFPCHLQIALPFSFFVTAAAHAHPVHLTIVSPTLLGALVLVSTMVFMRLVCSFQIGVEEEALCVLFALCVPLFEKGEGGK